MNVFESLKEKGKNLLRGPRALGAAVLAVVAIVVIGLMFRAGGSSGIAEEDAPTKSSVDAIVQHGQVLLTEKINAGEDLSNGPCLDNNDAFPGWVIDIAHDPRTDTDDNPENQCSAYRRGKAKNFVELSTSGDVIRIFPEIKDPESE